MKKVILLMLAVLLLFGLCACGQDGSPSGQDTEGSGELLTMGDALSVESDYTYSGWDDKHYVYVFDNHGVPTRVVAAFSEELCQALDEIDFFDEERDEKIYDLLSPLELESVEDLSSYIPAQEELDQLVGKTGQELLDDGYEIWGHEFQENKTAFTLVKGLCEFEFEFNEVVTDDEDIADEEIILPLTVKSAKYQGISSNSADLEQIN